MLKFLLQLIKYICCCAMFFVALVLIVGPISDAPGNPFFLIIPAMMALAGYCTYREAKRKALEGSAFTWWLYGTFIPVVSWIDVHKAPSVQSYTAEPLQQSARNATPEKPDRGSYYVSWEMWEMEHDKPEQRKRWLRAAKDCSLVKVLDESQGVALVRGNRGGEYTTSLVMCSCSDFAKRHKPCKHMYFLAHHLGVFDPFNMQV